MLHTAYIALGSNLGNREQALDAALAQITETANIRLNRLSNFLENPAVGGPVDSPSFINAVAELQTTLTPAELLKALLQIEKNLGRHRREKWGPRSIDLDLLLYDDQTVEVEGLIVPHPLMHQRRFVLKPLAEIAPGVMHPKLQKSISQLLRDL